LEFELNSWKTEECLSLVSDVMLIPCEGGEIVRVGDETGNVLFRPLEMDFEQQFGALICFHLEEHASGGNWSRPAK
jgi:hypothetical protein